jgi:2-polyprenyl-6-hydroxyphenyl methylase/3-demethylubiquinone-9 3-methyltransferase
VTDGGDAAPAGFDFGANWLAFSAALRPEQLDAARASLLRHLPADSWRGRRVVDVGCGSGLFAVAMAQLGADVTAVDVNAKSVEATRLNAARFLGADAARVASRVASILDDEFVRANAERFDVVYSWGVLHHTGAMDRAVANALALVKRDGFAVIALYDRHWTSPVWRVIKCVYCALPGPLATLYAALFVPVIAAAKFAVSGKNPFRKERGMSFWRDVVDWVGGYPYEYVGPDEFARRMSAAGFACRVSAPADTPIGCNEFFVRRET